MHLSFLFQRYFERLGDICAFNFEFVDLGLRDLGFRDAGLIIESRPQILRSVIVYCVWSLTKFRPVHIFSGRDCLLWCKAVTSFFLSQRLFLRVDSLFQTLESLLFCYLSVKRNLYLSLAVLFISLHIGFEDEFNDWCIYWCGASCLLFVTAIVIHVVNLFFYVPFSLP